MRIALTEVVRRAMEAFRRYVSEVLLTGSGSWAAAVATTTVKEDTKGVHPLVRPIRTVYV